MHLIQKPKSPQRWRKNANSNTGTTYEKRLPNRANRCKPQLDPPSKPMNVHKTDQQIPKIHQFIKTVFHQKKIRTQHFPDMPPRGLCRVKCPLSVGTKFSQNELQNRKENRPNAPRNLYMCSGHAWCMMPPDHVTLPSEMRTPRITWMIARNDPLAATTTMRV